MIEKIMRNRKKETLDILLKHPRFWTGNYFVVAVILSLVRFWGGRENHSFPQDSVLSPLPSPSSPLADERDEEEEDSESDSEVVSAIDSWELSPCSDEPEAELPTTEALANLGPTRSTFILTFWPTFAP
jgi:hypothetical protein